MSDKKPQPEKNLPTQRSDEFSSGGENSSDDNLKKLQTVDFHTTLDMQQESQDAVEKHTSPRAQIEARRKEGGIFRLGMTLRLEVKSSQRPIEVIPSEKTIIGRRDPLANIVPDLDLASHAGYQLGLSRCHAVIQQRENRIDILDLGSKNGTYLNGKRLKPEVPEKLHNGDELRLGKMVVHLFFTEVSS